MRLTASAYGRSASMRCSARRRRAAATISIARVIFWMFLTEEILVLTSRCDAIVVYLRGQLGRLRLCLLLRLGLLVGLRLGLRARSLVLQRLALLVEVVAEVLSEGINSGVNGFLGLLRPVAAGDLVTHVWVLGVHAFDQGEQELGHALDVQAVQEAVGGGEDLDRLVLDRQRRTLVLVERLDQPLTAGERLLGVRVEV